MSEFYKRCIKRRDIKFCPLCGGSCSPVKGFAQCSVCGGCFLVWIECSSSAINPKPREGGHMQRQECGTGGGKIRHASVAEAFARCMDIEEIPRRNRETMQFYECRFCGFIHMGHGGKRKKNATITYSYATAKSMYEEALARGEFNNETAAERDTITTGI